MLPWPSFHSNRGIELPEPGLSHISRVIPGPLPTFRLGEAGTFNDPAVVWKPVPASPVP